MSGLSWEDMVNAMCVNGRPEQVADLSGKWDVLLRNARSVSESLRDGMGDLAKSWKGPAAEDYCKKVLAIADQIDQFDDEYRGIVTALKTSSDSLNDAQTGMPVPDYMLDEVRGRQADLDRMNNIGSRAAFEGGLAVFTGGGSLVVGEFLPNSFYNGLASTVGSWTRETAGWLSSKWDDFGGKMTKQAAEYYDRTDRTTQEAKLNLSDPSTIGSDVTYTPNPVPLKTTGPGPGIGAMPGAGGGGAGAHLGANPSLDPHAGPGLGNDPGAHFKDPSAGHPGVGTGHPGSGSSHPGAGSGFDPTVGHSGIGGGGGAGGYDPKTGLAGAGGGSLSGAGAGGLGGGLSGSGLGGSGLGAGSGLGGAGRPVSTAGLTSGMPGLGGAGAGGAGAGRGAGGRGGGRTGAGGPGAGHGGGGHGPDDEYGTWLIEDDDPWGGNSSAPPGVLGA